MVNFAIALLLLLMIIILIILAVWKFVCNPKLERVETYYDHFGSLFDGIIFSNKRTKCTLL